MIYGTAQRIAPKQPQGFEGLIGACTTPPELLRALLTYSGGDVPTQELLWGAAAALALVGNGQSAASVLPEVVRSKHDLPIDRLVHACAVAGVQDWADPEQLLSGVKLSRVHDSLQRELNRLPHSTLPKKVVPGHRDALIQLGTALGQDLHVPSRLTQHPGTRLIAPIALGVVFSTFGQTIAAAEPGGSSTEAAAAANSQNDERSSHGSGFTVGFQEQQAASVIANVGGMNGSTESDDGTKQGTDADQTSGVETPIVSEQTATTEESDSTQTQTPVDASTAEPSPTPEPSEQATQVPAAQVTPSLPPTQEQTTAPDPTTQQTAPGNEHKTDPPSDPNAPVTGEVSEYPTSPQGVQKFWEYAQSIIPGGADIGVQTPPSAAGAASELSDSVTSSADSAVTLQSQTVIEQIPFVAAYEAGTDVEANGNTVQNPPAAVTEQVIADIKSMGRPELHSDFFTAIEDKANHERQAQQDGDNTSRSSNTPETATDKETLLKAIDNLEAKKPEWKNILYIVKRYIQAGKTRENGEATAARGIIETGKERLDPATEQSNSGPGRGFMQWGNKGTSARARAYDRFGYYRQADGTYRYGTLRWHAESNNKDWQTIEAQVDFNLWELGHTERTANKAFKSAGHNLRANAIATLKYTRPASWLSLKTRGWTIRQTLEKTQMIHDAIDEEYQKIAGKSSGNDGEKTTTSVSSKVLKIAAPAINEINASNISDSAKAKRKAIVVSAVKMSDAYPYPVPRFKPKKKLDPDFVAALKKYDYDPNTLNAKYDCLKFVTVAVRESGADKDFNSGRKATGDLYRQVLETGKPGSDADWQVIKNPKKSELQPGDILLMDGHAAIWVDKIKGRGFVARLIEAALGSKRTPSFRVGNDEYSYFADSASGFLVLRSVA